MVAHTHSGALDKSVMQQSPKLEDVLVNTFSKAPPISESTQTLIDEATAEDETLQKVIKAISTAWPGQHIPSIFHPSNGDCSVLNGILLKGTG